MTTKKAFFKLPHFAVVGASADRAKFGNKVLRSYQENNFKVIPINAKQRVVEGMACVASLTELSSLIASGDGQLEGASSSAFVGVSIVTPPSVTRQILQEGVEQGYRNFFLQPGTHDDVVDGYIKEITSLEEPKVTVHKGCVLVELGFHH